MFATLSELSLILLMQIKMVVGKYNLGRQLIDHQGVAIARQGVAIDRQSTAIAHQGVADAH
jgi:hypothetical protein